MTWNLKKYLICLLFRVQSTDACHPAVIQVKSEMILQHFWDYFAWSNFTKRFFTWRVDSWSSMSSIIFKKSILTTFIYASSFIFYSKEVITMWNYHVSTQMDQLLWPLLAIPIRSTGSLCNFMTKFKVHERTTRREWNLLIKVKLVQLNSFAQENTGIFFFRKRRTCNCQNRKGKSKSNITLKPTFGFVSCHTVTHF